MTIGLRYWAALDGKSRILATGVTYADRRFNRKCLSFSILRYMVWLMSGRRYCRLLVSSLVNIRVGTPIKDVPHKRIRYSKTAKRPIEINLFDK